MEPFARKSAALATWWKKDPAKTNGHRTVDSRARAPMGSESVETRKSRSVRENEPTAREGLGGLGPSLMAIPRPRLVRAIMACGWLRLGLALGRSSRKSGFGSGSHSSFCGGPRPLGAIALWMVGEASCEASQTTFPPTTVTQDDALQQCIHSTPKGDCCLAPWRENRLLRRLEEWYWPGAA